MTVRRMLGRPVLLGAVALALTASGVCAQGEVAKTKRDRTILTQEEMLENPSVTNAFEAVQRFRPNWLRVTRGAGRIRSQYGDQVRPPPGGSRPGDPVPGEGATPNATPLTNRLGGYTAQATRPILYIDEIKQHEFEIELRNLKVGEIREIKYLTGNQASGRFGAGHEFGALLLTTTRAPTP